MFCTNCGEKVPEDARFCPGCGEEIQAAAPEPEPRPTEAAAQPAQPPEQPPRPVEPAAGAPPQPAAPPQQPAPPTPEVAQPPPKKGSATCWIVGCIILALLVLAGGIVGLFALRYARSKAAETLQDIQQEIEEGVPTDALPSEGGDESETSTDSNVSSDTGGSEVSLSDLSEEAAKALGEAAAQIERTREEMEAQSRAPDVAGAVTTLAMFLDAQASEDGDAVQKYLSGQARAGFVPETWGQGDFEHVEFNVVSQKQQSPASHEFEVNETCRDLGTNENFTDTWRIVMSWDGERWTVSEWELLD